MKDGGSFEQCYNAQAAVEIESRLIVGRRVSDAPNDKEQLAPTLEAVSPAAGSVSAALLDSGYYSEKAVMAVEQGGQGRPLMRRRSGTVTVAAWRNSRNGPIRRHRLRTQPWPRS